MDKLLRALRFLEANVEGPLDGRRLSGVAGLSRFHFHRRFEEVFGVGLRAYVEQVRLRRAAYRLAFRPHERILDVALDTGFGSHEAFGRAFKRAVGQTPSEFRSAPRWDRWAARNRALVEIRTRHLHATPGGAVRIESRPRLRVLGLAHRPEHGPLLATAQRFIEWRRRTGLPPRTTPTFNLVQAEPATFAFCVGTDREVALAPDMFVGALPAGRCAVLRHVGDEESLRAHARWLVGDWKTANGHVGRGAELVFQRLTFFPDVAEREAVTEIVLPLA